MNNLASVLQTILKDTSPSHAWLRRHCDCFLEVEDNRPYVERCLLHDFAFDMARVLDLLKADADPETREAINAMLDNYGLLT